MYSLLDENANKYTTFDTKYVNMVGQKVDIEYNEEQVAGKKEGQVFTNRTITEKPASKGMADSFRAKAQELGAAMNNNVSVSREESVEMKQSQLDRIEKMVKEIHGRIIEPF